jgi:hypothetical protein
MSARSFANKLLRDERESVEAGLQGSWMYKDELYNFQRIVRYKHPDTRKWMWGVEYTPWNAPTEHFIRELEEFKKRFKPYVPVVA